MTKNQSAERGNVLFLILIAVALFAALSYAVTSATRGGSDSGSGEKAQLQAASILNYQTALKVAVDRMVISGVSPDDIDFTRPSDAGFNTAPYTRKIFHPQGGGVSYQNLAFRDLTPLEYTIDYATLFLDRLNPISSAYALGYQAGNGGNQIGGIDSDPDISTVPPSEDIKGSYLGRFNNIGWSPTSAQDIVFTSAKISNAVCKELNKKLANTTTIPVVSSPETYLVAAAYTSASNSDFTASQCAACENQNAMCIGETASGPYYFYNIVMAR